jgi:cyclopropane-fatty-acyl-phospholipid synthase
MSTLTKTIGPAQSRVRHYDLAAELLGQADVEIDGPRPWDIRIHHPRAFDRFLAQGRLGAGESYEDGWWDCDALDELACRVLRSNMLRSVQWKSMVGPLLKAHLVNLQSPRRAFRVGEAHYDLGNDLFAAMLDSRMVYTCGYWEGAATLDTAQENKLDLVCRKIGLEPGMRVLDIGCGWGAFGKFAAERYGAETIGVTVSREQVELGRELCRDLPVSFLLKDYRDIHGRFDRIVSLGMFEHVGEKNYRTFMETVRHALVDDGLFLLHTIGSPKTVHAVDPYINRYIFPNSLVPSAEQIARAFDGLFVLEDWHSFGADYDKTLMAWWRNFDAHWPELLEKYGERFHRRWRYYLLTCAGSFRARTNQLWQIVLSPRGVPGGYCRVS